MDDLYSDSLLEAAAGIPPVADMSDMAARARRTSRVCGSEVEVGLAMEGGRVTDIALDVKACALGQAAASLFAGTVRGATAAEVRQVAAQMRAMLTADGPSPDGRWAALAQLAPIRAYPARHASTLLVFDAAVDCVDHLTKVA
ncbi:hypothetical protein PB2503_01612 [Parvularcula bermudensis HTCC2503]|uniref:NIF system FeS cluster assembly NifU N-terminal domain-containing protein n=1 Tax=Parvularcula bermudensis (strain ATCC BAA-594 / HTCC2503 / KCTC 12087) TaxID=314260 RepID=E0TBM6_PARBH|nr:hypothetical protein PB2503_01612 [Parvularcula bermudensis HTCC2503]